MAEIRPRVWLAAGACLAAAAALPLLTSLECARAGRAASAEPGERARASARIWPPPDAPFPTPALSEPARGPLTREELRDLWDAEDAAAELVTRSGPYADFEVPEPPRRPGESRDAHRRRSEALRRQVLADALLAEVRMREHFESSSLPQGGLLPQEYRRRFQRPAARLAPRERLQALQEARIRLEAQRSEPDPQSDAS